MNATTKPNLEIWMGTSPKTPWTLIISILTIISLLAVIAYGRVLSQEYKELNSNLNTYIEEASEKNVALADLTASIGYGGLIHNFKNYILRQNNEYYDRVIKSFDQTNYLLNKLGQILKTEEQIEQLRHISKTVQEYKSKFFLAVRHIEKGITPQELDKIVKINDAEALSAIQALTLISQKRSQEFLDRTNLANERYAFYLKFMFVIGAMVIVVGSVIIYIVKRLMVGVGNTDQAYNYIKALYDATPDALLAVSREGIIEKANRQAESIFGYSNEILIGMKVEMLMPEAFREAHVAMRQSYFENPGFRPMGSGLNLKARRSDGHEIDIEISLSHNKINDVEQAIVAIRDISNARKTERELAISLTRENRAEKFKAKLLSNMSHELRTPIGQISGFAQLIINENDERADGKVKDWAYNIENASESLLKLVDNVLRFTQKDKARSKIKVTKLNEAIDEVISHIEFDSNYKSSTIELVQNEDIEKIVYCARHLLEESLHELLINSIKFSGPSKPQIKVQIDIDQDELILTVCDQGTGIPEEALEDVFKPFERLDAFDNAIDGVGMGLTLLRQMIMASDGKIKFIPQEKGACVEVRLPCSFNPF